MIVRAARVEDAPALARVIVDTCRSAHRDHVPEDYWQKRYGEWTYEESERNWLRSLREIARERSPRMSIYVAENEAEEVVGLAVGGPPKEKGRKNTGEIYALYVRDHDQRRGLGRHLVQAVATHLASLGMTALIIGCLAVNTRARQFYEALGGRVVGERTVEEYGFTLQEVIYGWSDTRALVATARVEPEGEEG
jgi:ribosomal protein S18 acetylase RimI-like enzyme